jgi:hypothetical protein
VQGIAFRDLGRSTVDPPNNTTFDELGNVVAIGTNQIGRYSLHFHHLIGPVNPTNTGYQYRASGNVIEGGRKWGVVIHQSHFGLISENVAYNIEGAGFATEDGNEAANEIVHNFAVHIVSPRVDESRGGIGSPPGAPGTTGFSGDGFWNRGPHNYLRRNVAANTSFSGYNYNGYYLRTARIPKVRGADPEDISQWLIYANQNIHDVEGEIFENIPLLESSDNEAYGLKIGLWITWPGGTMGIQRYVNESVIERFTAWHATYAGIDAYHVAHFTYNDCRLLNDPTISSKNDGSSRIGRGFALQSPTYENGKTVINDAEVRGFNVGIDLPHNVKNDDVTFYTTRIDGAYLENYVNVVDNAPATRKRTELRHVDFVAAPMPALPGLPAQPKNVSMEFEIAAATKVMLESTLVIEDSNIGPMQVFHLQQHPDYVVPQSTDPNRGYPVAGLTNEQGWAAYGTAICGRVLPSGATSRPDIDGYVIGL